MTAAAAHSTFAPMAAEPQTQEIDIEAPLDLCLAVLLDFERYPDWSSAILECQSLERDTAGRATRVAFALDAKIRTVRYTLAYTLEAPATLRWTLVTGDLAAVDGSYVLTPSGPQRTHAVCTQAVDPGFWLPGPLRRFAERQALSDSVGEFRSEAERRAKA